MLRKKILLFVVMALITSHAIFSQAVGIDAALANATRDISGTVPSGTRMAILNITSDYVSLSDYIINELILHLVRTGLFQVVPRTTVELELAGREFDFQMSGLVSDEAQRSLGQFLGLDTFISGSIVRETATTYRLIINAIHLETFTFQTVYGVSVLVDRQMQALTGRIVHEDFTTAERLRMGALNMLAGSGSITNGQPLGWGVAAGQGIGLLLIVAGFMIQDDEYDERHFHEDRRRSFFMAGGAAIGGAILFGYIIPFFHTRPNPAVASGNSFPFNLELVSSNNRDINGFRVSHTMRF